MISLLGWAILHGAGTLIQVADIIRGSGLERMEESGKLICAVCEDNTGRNTVTQDNTGRNTVTQEHTGRNTVTQDNTGRNTVTQEHTGSRNTEEERALLSN